MELVKIYFLIFIIYSMTGWLLEVISTYPDTKCFVNRGFMIGPYCPIYGKCALLMIFLLHPFKKIYTIFIMSVIICSLSPKLINILFYSILTIYICDFFVSFKVIMKVKNMSIKYVNLDNTKEITEKIKSILNDKLLTRRIIKAFPNIKFNIKKAVENLKEKFEQS